MEIQHLTDDPLFILAIGILVVIGGIIGLRLHAFLALLLGAFVVAILTPEAAIILYATSKGLSLSEAQNLANQKEGIRIAVEFGKTCGKIGIIIAMASIIGKTMLESGAAEKIVRSALKITGVKKCTAHLFRQQFFYRNTCFF